MCILFLETTNMKDISNLGVISVFSNRRYSTSWRTSISGSLTLGQGWRTICLERQIFPEDLSGWAVTGQIQPFGKRAGQKRARIVIQGNCCLCYDRVLHQETQGLEIKTRASDRVHRKPEAKCAHGACPGTADQALINSGEAWWERSGEERRNTVAMTGHYIPRMSLTIPRPTGGCSSSCAIHFFPQSGLLQIWRRLLCLQHVREWTRGGWLKYRH